MVHRTKWIGKLGTTFDPPKNNTTIMVHMRLIPSMVPSNCIGFSQTKRFLPLIKATDSKHFVDEMSIYHLIFSFLFRQDEVLRRVTLHLSHDILDFFEEEK